MADFKTSFDRMIKWEGWCITNVEHDKGGLTVCGIARNIHPSWPGWDKYDDMMRRTGKADLEVLRADIMAFYERMYFPLDDIDSQKIADQIYQAYINCGSVANKWAQMVCNEVIASGLKVDGIIGRYTLSAINKVDTNAFLPVYCDKQKKHYLGIIMRDPTQEKFRIGWLKRADDFVGA